VNEVVKNSMECTFQQNHNFEQPEGKLDKEYIEIGGVKENTRSSAVTVADSNFPRYYKTTPNKIENSKTDKSSSNGLKQVRILIAEPEPNILSLFKAFLETLEIKPATVADGKKALDIFLEKENKGKPYDVVVLDTHLQSLGGLDLAKIIRDISPTQRIILITTTPLEYLPKNIIEAVNLDKEDILIMPFRLASFISKLKY
jgi:two-component system, OmpR family, response regulator